MSKIFKFFAVCINILTASFCSLNAVIFLFEKGPDKFFGIIPLTIAVFATYMAWVVGRTNSNLISRKVFIISLIPFILLALVIYLILFNVQLNYMNK